MKNKIVAIGFILLLFMTGFFSVSTLASIESTQGTFEAELGRRGNERPIVTLDGTYHTRNRYFIVGGTAKTDDQIGRFRGIFSGNHFIIRIPIREDIIFIFGRCRFDEEHQNFRGFWIGRGIPIQGWIRGSFTPTD